MNTIISLISMSHPGSLDDILLVARDHTCTREEIAQEVGALLSSLRADDTFNEYTEEQLLDAIYEVIEGA